jgi:hypothetical protein
VAAVRRRWDIDERGEGVADATRLLPDARVLLDAMAEPLWVTEQPEAHLLPHIARACAAFPVELGQAHVDANGVLVVDLRWTDPWNGPTVGAAAFALLGSFAEEMSYVRKDVNDSEVVLETVTGVVSDGEFAPHGHTVRLRVSAG